jgi:hypothetical protein
MRYREKKLEAVGLEVHQFALDTTDEHVAHELLLGEQEQLVDLCAEARDLLIVVQQQRQDGQAQVAEEFLVVVRLCPGH